MNQKSGKKRKTDFIVSKEETTLIYGQDAIIRLNYKDFMSFVKVVTKRHRQFSKEKCYEHFTHLSPDVSFFMVKK